MGQLQVQSVADVHYQVDGTGHPAWLLFNGATLPLQFWDPVVAGLPGTIVRFDQRNAGRTVAQGSFTLTDVAADAASVLAHLGIGRVIVGGHAWGGRVAQVFARDYPHMTRALAVCGTGGQLPAAIPDGLARELGAALRAQDRARWEQAMEATYCARGFSARDPEAFRAICNLLWQQSRSNARWDARVAPSASYWGTASVPTLLIYGREDRNGTPANAADLAQRIAGADLHFIEEAGHFVVREQPARVQSLMRDFAAALPADAPPG